MTDCVLLPKAELHSHLGGTIRRSTLASLLEENAPSHAKLASGPLTQRGDLSYAFEMFGLIHKALSTESAIYRCTLEAIEDAERDGVRYLELRTTPRALGLVGTAGPRLMPEAVEFACSQHPLDAPLHAYVSTVVDALVASGASHPRIAVRLLLSMDRGALGGKVEWEAVARVVSVWSAHVRVLGLPPFPDRPTRVVVGVDVSGHPGKGELSTLLPLLENLRRNSGSIASEESFTSGKGSSSMAPRLHRPLGVTIHLGEITNDKEVEEVLAWGPDRVGHMCHVPPTLVDDLLLASKFESNGAVPRSTHAPPVIELCPTSNIVTLGLESISAHPLIKTWLHSALPLTVCTDDVGVFQSPLSSEYQLLAEAFDLGTHRVALLARDSFRYGFAEEDELEAAARL